MARRRLALFAWLGCLAMALACRVHAGESAAYEFPIKDSFRATVIGTPEPLQEVYPKIPVRTDRLTVFPDRKVPDYLWYEGQLRYSYALQEGAAPLVFLIAGTGGAHNSPKNYALGRALYHAGFHVVSLSSPTFPNFIVSASSTGVPGHAVHDAEDLYRVMTLIRERLRKDMEVTGVYLAGYSLGGFNAAFVSWLDDQRKQLDFKRVLLINPPVRLYESMSVLDRMLESIPGGMDNFHTYYERMVREFSVLYSTADRLEFSEEFLYAVFRRLQPRDDELAAMIGLSFRFSAANLMFTADLMTDFGFIKPANVRLDRNSSPGDYPRVAMRLGFTDYFHRFFYPFYNARLDKPVSRDELIRRMSLEEIADYLRNSDKVYVMHNRDDLILGDGGIAFFTGVFGERARIYPNGGHLGNLEYPDNMGYMLRIMKSLVKRR
jgi:pimeloyl-ACP methyl ester carboxylesterase